ncbi:MAG: ATP-dependent DNA helicase RecG [Bacteroidales bacterium]|nr:ATP-dependent DNA helicase RecG [Bacteroidales bacterium]
MDRLASTKIIYLKGVGPVRGKLLEDELGIATFRDLLYTAPRRYIDRRRVYRIRELQEDMPDVQVAGRFLRFDMEGEGAKKRLTGLFTDGQTMMQVVWFNRHKQIAEAYNTSTTYLLLGKPNNFKGTWSMAHPEIEVFDPAKPPEGLRGVYPLTETLRRRGFTLRTIPNLISTIWANTREINDTLPQALLQKYSLMPLKEALHQIHNPDSPQALQLARERLKFEELFYLELHIMRYARARNEKLRGQIFSKVGPFFNKFYSEVLPFELTGAQKRVLREIRQDTRTGAQMNRLLQGDVGSGKTMVAFMSMLLAVDNGCQACMLAPTEILATQHYEAISEWAEKIGLNVRLLTGSTRAKARREIDQGLLSGEINILIGTHAVIEERVQFRNLGMAVIDEQHRFGVAQRARIWGKNEVPPHVLVMTATPIPRTLAMTLYGDLQVSVIDELPPGRKPITTMLRYDSQRMSMWRGVGTELKAGRQAYVVVPLISENEKLSLRSLEEAYEAVCDIFSDYKVARVHGKMKPSEKDYQMQLFASGEAQILVATTVIEVGVNVPNASVMVIENAERFGLSQLHQLRGRVGRGADKSYCILMTHEKINPTTRKRLEIMTSTTDGFLIAEADMHMRGPGDMEGTQQSGLALNLRHASLVTDGQILERAREAAEAVLNGNMTLHKINAAAPSGATAIQLPATDLALLGRELSLRFANDKDWGLIS